MSRTPANDWAAASALQKQLLSSEAESAAQMADVRLKSTLMRQTEPERFSAAIASSVSFTISNEAHGDMLGYHLRFTSEVPHRVYCTDDACIAHCKKLVAERGLGFVSCMRSGETIEGQLSDPEDEETLERGGAFHDITLLKWNIAKALFKDHKFVMFVDDDVLIRSHDFPFLLMEGKGWDFRYQYELVGTPLPGHKTVIPMPSKRPELVNTGTFMLRRNEEVFRFIDDVMKCSAGRIWEQGCAQRVTGERGEDGPFRYIGLPLSYQGHCWHRDETHLVLPCSFNTYHPACAMSIQEKGDLIEKKCEICRLGKGCDPESRAKWYSQA